MTNSYPIFMPEAGSTFVGMANFDGYVMINADASVAAVGPTGSYFGPHVSVAKTGTGEYTVTLDRSWNHLFPHADFTANAAVDLETQLGLVTNNTFVVRTVAGATPTNASAICGFFFQCRAKTSSV